MLRILGSSGRLCDSLSRRELLSVGGLSLLGLSLPDVLRRQAMADAAKVATTQSRSDVLATVHHALGIDSTTEYRDTLNRPRRLVENGKPIVGLF
jgi:hypothetical protein